MVEIRRVLPTGAGVPTKGRGFILAARSLGVDSIAQAALASYPEFIRQHFGLPGNRKLVCGISFGYADDAHPINQYRTERAPISAAVQFVD